MICPSTVEEFNLAFSKKNTIKIVIERCNTDDDPDCEADINTV